MTVEQRRDGFGLRPDRADTIVTATSIFVRVAELFKATAIVAPGVGLKEGILEELVDKYFNRWDNESETRTVDRRVHPPRAQRYGFDQAHGELVASFAASLFDDMAAVHRLGERDRLLLRAAAAPARHRRLRPLRRPPQAQLLPDPALRHHGPHSRWSAAIVANVARYHRKSPPDPVASELPRPRQGRSRQGAQPRCHPAHRRRARP